VFAFALNFGAVLVAALGYIGPAVAAIIHQGSSLAVILNCLRLLVEGKAVQDRPLERIWFSWKERLHRLRQKTGRALGGLVHEKGRNILLWTAWFFILLWLLSGLVIIGPDQVGVVQRFARLVEGELGPGVHYRWPWPVERVTRVAPHKVRTLEIGFRRSIEGGSEPRVYVWNTRHMSDRFRQVIEESLMLSGDENLVEVYGVVHYDISDPALFLFQTRNPEKLMRLTAERTLRWTIARVSLDEILTTALSALEEAWKKDLSQAHEDYGSGLRIQSVFLKHVHPPLEVVPAFREVATALEDRSTRINEAEGYLREQVPIAHGMARARLIEAAGYSESRIRRSQGESERFTSLAEAFQDAAETTVDRLYLETIERILAGKPKYITKGPHTTGRRRFLFFDSEDLGWLNLGGQEKGSP
jgi:HflK protein